MIVEYFSFKDQSEKNKTVISQILYKSFDTKFKPIFKKVTIEEGINIIKQTLAKTSGLLAREGAKILGVAILSSSTSPSLYFDKKLKKKLGLLSYIYLNHIFKVEDITDNATIKIELLAITKGAREQGIGSKILSEIVKYSRTNKYKKILLEVVDTNPRAKILYKRIGFKTTKTYRSGIFTKAFGFGGYDDMCLKIQKKNKLV
jgi:GNAT superfamily N-acetyltransferase